MYILFHIFWCCIIVRCALCCLVNLINGIFSPMSPSRSPHKSLSRSPRRILWRIPRRSLSKSKSERPRIISSMSMSRSPRRVLSRIPRMSLSRSPSLIARRVVSKNPSHRDLSTIQSVIACRNLSKSPQRSLRSHSWKNLAQSPLKSWSRPSSRSLSRGSSHSPIVNKSTLLNPNQSHTTTRIPSPEGTPKHVRRGRGFN